MNFIKTTLLGGLAVLFPLLLFWLALSEIAGLLMVMVDPLVDLFPENYFNDAYLPGVLSAFLIAVAAFICGLFARATFVRQLAISMERNLLDKLPIYQMLKKISNAFLDVDSEAFTPALLDAGDGSSDPCYIVEEFGDDLATILLPWSPTSFAGSIKIVPQNSLRKLNCSLDDLSRAISLMGTGVADYVQRAPLSRQT